MAGWNTAQIAAERRQKAEVSLADATREELLNRIVALETSLYKLTYSLSDLDVDPGPRSSAFMTSKFFPHRYLDKDEKEEFCTFDPATRQFVGAQVSTETMQQVDYALADSVDVRDGSKLSDDLEILNVHQSATAASIWCGAIYMGDVREAAKLLWGKP